MKKIIAAISALCIVSTTFVSAAKAVNAEPAPKAQNTAQTASQDRIYNIASVSKMYSTLAVMQLVDEGKVELDAPVTDYLPEFEMEDERYRDLTVRMLMDHTNGIAMGNGINHYLYNDADSYVHDIILDIIKEAHFKADPGEYPCYGNYGFFLLELITENVSGMSYTDYVRENIASKIGAEHTGTAWSLYAGDLGDARASLYSGAQQVEYPYEMAAGPGGIYSTAPDVADFGAAFFTGNETLLSDSAKSQMSTRQSSDPKAEGYGLGWDFVEQVRYEKENVKVCGKGGDLPYMHSFLLVAPDEQISTAVLTAGNDSSEIAGLMAEALMDVVLEERGKTISDAAPSEPTMTDTVPDSFRKYEGLYCVGGVYGTGICRIYFDSKYMYMEKADTGNSSPDRYRYTDEGSFVKVGSSGKMTSDREIVYFEEKDGKVYIRTDKLTLFPGLGSVNDSMYSGEKMEENTVPESVQKSWDELAQTSYVLYNEKWSSQTYDSPFSRSVTDKAFPGYVLTVSSTGQTKVHKITDENTAQFFTTIPSSANRDLYDIDITEHTYSDGVKSVSVDLSDMTRWRRVDTLPEFGSDISEVKLNSSEAQWYRIGKDMAGKTISAERPENSAVYVYNKFREPIYSTHVKGTADTIDLPAGGYIVFLGETGGSVKLFG